MSAVAEPLGVARSNLAERKNGVIKLRGRYREAGDAELTPLIRAIFDERPTYGYRRLCVLANRKLRAEGKPPVNMKRVLRIMQTCCRLNIKYNPRRDLQVQQTPRRRPKEIQSIIPRRAY